MRQVLAAFSEHRSVLFQAPTGAGKTVMSMRIVKELPKPALFIAERIEIIRQTARSFSAEGFIPDVLTADVNTSGGWRSPWVTIAAQRTIWSRAVKRGHDFPDFKTIVVDESHRARARTYEEIIKLWPTAKLLLLTATPIRSDGLGMGNIAEVMVQGDDYGGNYEDLIDHKVLVPCPPRNVWSWPKDLRGIRTQAGDYVMGGSKGADKSLNVPKYVGEIVSHWQKLGENRRTVVYATSIAHAENIAARFEDAGISARAIHSKTDPEDRRLWLEQLEGDSDLQVVTNFGVLTEGWDSPKVSCIILARPTKIFGLYLQIVGRALRAAPNKTDMLLLDHAGIVPLHGLPGQNVVWSLDSDTGAAKIASQRKNKPCPQCGAIMEGPRCSRCDYVAPEANLNGVSVSDDECDVESREDVNLVRFDDDTIAEIEQTLMTPAAKNERAELFRLRGVASQRGFKPGWVAHKFKTRFGRFPENELYLPNPLHCDPQEYLEAAREFARERGWKPGWAAVRYKELYGKWPPRGDDSWT